MTFLMVQAFGSDSAPKPARRVEPRLSGFGDHIRSFLLCLLIAHATHSAQASSAVFGGGPFYTGGTSMINVLRSSGFTTVMLWTIHVDSSTGNLIYNNQLVVSNGVYVGNAAWPGQLATLKTAPTSVNRIEVSVGSAGVNDFQSIQTLISNYGTNTTSILFRNFQALKNATHADAIDYDDESLYSVATDVEFGQMLSSIGYKVTFCPYTDSSVWQSAYTQLGSIVDAIYLQCYAGGAGNNPGTWNGYFGGLKVQPGMWCSNGSGCSAGSTAAQVASQMAAWRSADGIPGGFMWLYDDMLSCANGGTPADYAAAINAAVDPLIISPTNGFAAVTAYNLRSIPTSMGFALSNSSASTISWSAINTSSWLNVSSPSGGIGPGSRTVVTASLNAAVATNLAFGLYSASIVFSNTTTGITLLRNFTLDTAVINWPLALNGFNTALLASTNATAASPGATAFDIPNAYCFYQAGLGGGTRGLPLNGVFPSQCDSATAFQIGPYGATNALLLGYGNPQAGTLAVSAPQPFNLLTVLSCSANASSTSQGTLVVNFSNGTKSPVFSFNAQDWFNTVTNVAIQGFGRLKLGTTFAFDDDGSTNPNLYQTSINLAALGLTQPVASITFSNPANAGAQQTTAILAVSGMASDIPIRAPAGLTAIPGTNAGVQLAWNVSGGATNYNVQRSLISGGPYAAIGRTAQTNYHDTGLANGTTYYYVVSAVGTQSASANSSEVGTMPGSYQSWVMANKPLAYWPLNETSGAAAFDPVGGYNGTYVGGVTLGQPGAPLFGFGPTSYSPQFDGASGYVNVPEGPFNLTNAITVVAWVTVSAVPHFSGIVGRGDSSWRLSLNPTGLPGGSDGTSYGDATSPTSIIGTNWHMIAYTFTGAANVTNNGSLYVDGALKAINTVGALSGDGLPVWIGGSPDYGTSRLLSGKIAQVAVFTNALPAVQIQALYKAATNIPPITLYVFPAGASSINLVWSHGTLLQSANPTGPWTTNPASSPYPLAPTNSSMYFKVLVN
jgi:hypothetical protein